MIDKLKPQTSAAWDWGCVDKKNQADAVLTKVVELTNVMKAKGATADAFKLYATNGVFHQLRPKLQPCFEDQTAAGELVFERTRWLVYRDTTRDGREKAAIRGSGQTAIMTVYNL